MGKRTDIRSILLIGSGPIVIGQACEFDYSGTQACKALREEGYRVILVNSNPATIMTDPSLADRTYIEPLTVDSLTRIIEIERPDAILPTLGGQTGLNLGMALHEQGVLAKYGVEMLGAKPDVIAKAEDRKLFKRAMENIGLTLTRSFTAYTMEEAKQCALELGFPCVIRASFTMGGTGSGIAYNMEELEQIAGVGIRSSMISEIMLEESILGWKEYELEVMRDKKDNVVIVCSIENLDPMGVHTGDSITVAPQQTLTDVEYQHLRDAAIAIMREIGVETGGSNVQFAVNPDDGRVVVIEMNPRVSRSSALASKATGFPIAKFAAKLAVGYTLDELDNDITKKTPACFEPSIDYCVIKIPRFNFEKFPGAVPVLGTSMKSVGEAMAIGRTFKEALQKGLRSLETKRFGFGCDGKDLITQSKGDIIRMISTPNPERLFQIKRAFELGLSVDDVFAACKIDRWFLVQLKQIVDVSLTLQKTPESIRFAKEYGFSDYQLARLLGESETAIREYRFSHSILPTYKLVDTCAGEFESVTPYFYSTYEVENEARITDRDKVMILGGGPNRIGQGIEFDYCCVHASFAIREMGLESIMVNSNPETVSTDYDTSDKLYFEPLTVEDVLHIYRTEKPKGVIIQFGGQTPLNLARQLEDAGVTILGTSTDSIDLAEDRKRFQALLQKLDLRQPQNATVVTLEEAKHHASKIGYPVVVRPSYVLGGAFMEIVYSEDALERYMTGAIEVTPDRPVLIDHYLENAIEVDVDALSDGDNCVVAGVMEHIEEAGIHSGDSACALPPYSLSADVIEEIKHATRQLAKELKVIGLLNIQFAIKDDTLYVLEVNPRASRTVPFVSKATGVPLAKMATYVMLGHSISSLGVKEVDLKHVAVKEAVFPFNRFPGVDFLLGPEMKSTGEVMGLDEDFGVAFLKSQWAAGQKIPTSGTAFISLKESDKTSRMVDVAKGLITHGFKLVATQGTQLFLSNHGVAVDTVKKVLEGRPNIVDHIKNGEVHLVVNTPSGRNPRQDEADIRRAALEHGVTLITTVAGASATVRAIQRLQSRDVGVKALQDYFN
jgi:carbamoyl-phosphate synthase large subunit